MPKIWATYCFLDLLSRLNYICQFLILPRPVNSYLHEVDKRLQIQWYGLLEEDLIYMGKYLIGFNTKNDPVGNIVNVLW